MAINDSTSPLATTEKKAVAHASVQPADGLHSPTQTAHGGELERNFSFLAALGTAFAILNSWTAMSASLSVVLPSGGPIAMIWGLCVSFVGTMSMALSLAEICHVYPLQGGQYDWSFLLSSPGTRKGVSFFTGWMACAGWVSLTATGSSLGAQFCTGLIALWHPNYEVKTWHTFVIYLAFALGAFVLNAFAVRLLPLVDRTALFWSLTGVVVVMITLLATASGDYQPGHFVFGQWINETGWPNGVAFILGLLQSTFGMTGFDGVTHMIEEMPNPAVDAPRVMILAVLMGASTSWIFLLVLLFSLSDVGIVIEATTGPLLQIYYQATNSRTGATCLLMFNLVAMGFATQGLMTVASRMCQSFARDRGFGQVSPTLQRIDHKLRVPLWSLIFTTVWVIIFGLTYLGSSAALNAILGSSVVFLQVSYMVPIALVLFRGRSILDQPGLPPRKYKLGAFGYAINAFALIFALVTSVFFCFPPDIPVESGNTMNYVCVVLAVVGTMTVVTWFVDARRRFNGPANLDKLLAEASDGSTMTHVGHTMI